MPGSARARGKLTYEKPPLTLDHLVARLAGRGLGIPDPDRTRRYLQHIGYYRLSPYTIPFQQGGPEHAFREGAVFDDVLDLYVFDRALRLLVMDAMERVEVAVRAALTDHMSTTYMDSHWYEAAAHSWLMVETLTIGQLNTAYRNLDRRADKSAVAQGIGLTATVLESWLSTYVRVRNICAHHGRLWNVGLGVYPAIPTSGAVSWLKGADAVPERSTKRLYPVLVSLQAVLDSVSPRSSWARRLHELLSTRPAMNLAGMGVPKNWAHDSFWSRHLP